MWEEPRPERVRQVGTDRDKSGIWLLVGLMAMVAVVAILVDMGILEPLLGRGEEFAPVVPSAPVASPRPIEPDARRPAPTPEAPGISSSMRTAPSSSGTARGDLGLLSSLTETCRYWTAQNTHGQYQGNQQMACRDMASYAQQHGLPVPSVGGSGPSVPVRSREPTATTRADIRVDQCERYGYGSVQYRQCRANEKRRLTDSCRSLRDERDRARGALYETLSRQASAMCSAAELYRIVN